LDGVDGAQSVAFGTGNVSICRVWKRKFRGGLLGFIGFMLSPLSWWNDAFVNLPLALAFAWSVSFFYRPAFGCALIAGYWLTNVLGLILMQKGAGQILSKEGSKPYTRRDLLRDSLISVLYTLLILMLLKLKIMQPLTGYLDGKK
jgi:hypothetical protein